MCRQEAGCERRRAENERDTNQCRCVPCLNTKEQLAHGHGSSNCAREPNDDTDRGEPTSLAHYHSVNCRTLRAKGHANADFARALTDGVGDDTVKAYDSEKKC